MSNPTNAGAVAGSAQFKLSLVHAQLSLVQAQLSACSAQLSAWLSQLNSSSLVQAGTGTRPPKPSPPKGAAHTSAQSLGFCCSSARRSSTQFVCLM